MIDRASSLGIDRDPFDEFLTAGLRAINRFAFCELVRLARIVRADIRHNPQMGSMVITAIAICGTNTVAK